MTNTKKLSDYTVSDIEKILKEDLSDNEMIELWNVKFASMLCESYVDDPEIIDEYLFNKKPSEVLRCIDTDFDINARYTTYDERYCVFVTFDDLDDDKNPIDYEQCAYLILEEEDKTTLKDVLDACNIDWIED